MNIKILGTQLLVENQSVKFSRSGRNPNLDLLKFISLLLVLLCHCSLEYFSDSLSMWSIPRISYCVCITAIPIFFTVSGCQLFGRENSGYRYASVKVLRLLKASFLFFLFLRVLRYFLWGTLTEISSIPSKYFWSFMQHGDEGILWFVGALMLVYMCYPLLNRLYVKNGRWFLLLSGCLFALQLAVFFFTIVRPRSIVLNEYHIPQTLRMWNWLGYFCLGGLIKRYRIFSVAGRWWVVLLLEVVVIVMCNAILVKRGVSWFEYFYTTPVVWMLTVAWFCWVMKLNIRQSRIIEELSTAFFPAYLLGYIFIGLLLDVVLELPYETSSILFWLLTAASTVCAGWLLMKIPGVGRLLKL